MGILLAKSEQQYNSISVVIFIINDNIVNIFVFIVNTLNHILYTDNIHIHTDINICINTIPNTLRIKPKRSVT